MITAENEVFLDYNMKMGGRWGNIWGVGCILGDCFLVGEWANFWQVEGVSPIPLVEKTWLTHFTFPKSSPIADAVLKKLLLLLEVSGLLTLPVLVFLRIAS